jgi:hypothetical protein
LGLGRHGLGHRCAPGLLLLSLLRLLGGSCSSILNSFTVLGDFFKRFTSNVPCILLHILKTHI